MAKTAILEVLESTIGRYVLNLDAESLNVAVWSGKIELQSLQLDVHAVNSELSRRAHEAPNLASPFRVCEGRFDKVQLDVPWARLSSRPVVFRASGLYVYMEPHDFLKEDITVENRWGTKVGVLVKKKKKKGDVEKLVATEERANSVNRAEAARQRMNKVRSAWDDDDDDVDSNDGSSSSSSSSNDSSFTSRLVRRIIENLQFEISDVHIAVRGCGCAAGLVLGSLSLVTTDAKGQRTFVDRKTNAKNPASSFLYKELLINGLGIYLQKDIVVKDHDGNSILMPMQQQHQRQMKNAEYVLSPLSFQAKLRQSDLDHCVDFPKYLIHSKLSSLSVQLSRNQLELGQRLALAVAPNREIRPLFPQYRPLDAILSGNGSARKWWKYAVRCIGRLNRHRSWIEFIVAFRKRKMYLELYKRHAHSDSAPWLTKLDIAECVQLDDIENDRTISVAGLMHWRTIADAQVGKEREKRARMALLTKKESSAAAMGGGGGGYVATASSTKRSSSIKSSIASSLFGSATRGTSRKESSDTFYECLDDDNDAPITLTADEMRELEELAMKKVDMGELTKDSMFCDINFNLGSFQVNLLTSSNQPLTSLEMGMVSASFKANADGSFTSGLSLLSLEVMDNVTMNTFYPTICRSLQKAHSSGTKSQAFQFQLKKSKEGNQELVLKMVACEIVASPLLLFALKEFFKLPDEVLKTPRSSSRGANNPLLFESVTGDEDVFFDAKEGMSSTMLLTPPAASSFAAKSSNATPSKTDGGGFSNSATTTSKDGGKVSDKVSSAIMDAWNGKNQQKQQWKMDMDISAPILIVPENCTDPNATVLICNFGRFNFTYGTEALSPAVVEWFDSHQRAHRMDSEVDHLKLEMNDLSFTISSVREASKNRLDEMNVDVSTSVIEPISFTLDIALEHTISSRDNTPRTCVVGVLPGIVLSLAPSHITQILRVFAIWTSNLHTLRGDVFDATEEQPVLSGVVEEPSGEISDPDLEIMSSGSGISILDDEVQDTSNTPAGGNESLLSKKDRLESLLFSRQESSGTKNAVEFMHVSVSLLRLSLNMYTDQGDGLEAHLVSVMASSSLLTDGTTSTQLSMGWFWMIDRLKSEQDLPRQQRLVCHSNLPRSATDYAHNDQYEAIMNDLTEQGVFKKGYAGSSDLADINIVKLPANKARVYHDKTQDFSRGYMQSISDAGRRTTVINAKFTSLFVNWNPHAIKTLFAAKSDVLDFKEKAYSTYERMSMLQHQQDHRPSESDKQMTNDQLVVPDEVNTLGVHSVFILAEMESFEISLNSAKDDLPLFTLTMSDSRVNHHSLEDDDANSEMTIVVGDFRMEASSFGRTLESYRTILGLAPSASTSLLSIKYSKGSNAVSSCNVGGADKTSCEACAEIVLSPMRFVHIHSQVFTLIEYVSEGVFGTIAASVASSAAAAAKAVAKSSQNGEKLFYIVASGFNLVVPQAAYSETHFSFHSGNFEAHYRAFEDDIGSEAHVSLKDVSLNCDQLMQMVSAPVNMTVSVKMKPPLSKGTEDERATRVEMSISRIRLLIARGHYAQAMHTIDYNISEDDNFLREKKTILPGTAVNAILKNLSHAGVEAIDVIKRMYINFNIQELAVEFCGATTDDPIMSLAAVKAQILMKLLPDMKETKAYVTLHDLVCDDRRIGFADRTFKRIIGRANVTRMASSNNTKGQVDDESEVFLLNYTKHAEDDSREIEVKIGSSQVVVLPDVLSDMLNFAKVAPFPYQRMMSYRTLTSNNVDGSTSMQVVVDDDVPNLEEIETSYELGKSGLSDLKKTNYSIDSSNMRLVLVDMGSIDSSGPFASTQKASALTETIVLQGKMKAKFEMIKDSVSDQTVEKDYKVDAERVEIYTAQGSNLLHPVQLLEPAKFALYYYQKVGRRSATHLTDLKFVTLSPIDLTISMQNAALASTLASSISESFTSDEECRTMIDDEFQSLSATDANRITRLDSALGKDEDESTQTPSEHPSNISVHAGKQLQSTRRAIKLKLTSPETTLTVTNDFQGLDEALFKICAMNTVFGGEITYPGVYISEPPCFGCNLNTSILADYFDAASNRWENLLTTPWELTFNASRSPETRSRSSQRMSSTFDIESSECRISFSEHFLVNVGAASRMWSVYSGATKKATELVEESVKEDSKKRRLSRSMAAHAARSLITTLPYAIENHSGIRASYSIYDDPMQFPLPTSSTQFFRFELFPERGFGGMRTYGQDIKHPKSLILYVGDTQISIKDMDHEVNKPRKAHYIPDFHAHVFVKVVKRGNSTVLHISSHVEMHNSSSIPFRVAVICDDTVHDLGVVNKSEQKRKGSVRDGSKSLLQESEDIMTHAVFGLPASVLKTFTIDSSETLCLQVSPVLKEESDTTGSGLIGLFNLPPLQSLVTIAKSDETRRTTQVICSPSSRGDRSSSLAANICCKVSLVDSSHPFVELFIEPRAVIVNKLPVSLILRTPMPHTFISTDDPTKHDALEDDSNLTNHTLKSLESVEVFTPGPSIAISLRCSDLPIGGTATDWVDGNFIDIPLKGKILEPLKCTFPFQTKSLDRYESSRQVSSRISGSDFYVLEAEDVTPDLKEITGKTNHIPLTKEGGVRTVVFMVCNYAVDHTGNLLFEKVTRKGDNSNLKSSKSSSLVGSPPYSAFSSAHHRRRVSLLPSSDSFIRLVKLTMDGDEGMRRTVPFRVEDCSIDGGIDALPILWGDTTPSGYFAYRHLTAEGSELHVVPEFVIFNGSKHHQIWVKQLARQPFLLDPLKITPIARDRNNSIVVQFEVPAINGLTGPVQIDKVGLRICVAKSKTTGEALGSLAVQTVTGAKDSRLVIKIGALNFRESVNDNIQRSSGLFKYDSIRLRVRWSEMRVTLKDTEEASERYEENRTAIRKYLQHHKVDSVELEKKLSEARHDYNVSVEKKGKFPDVAQILLNRFTVDFQRIFKEDDPKVQMGLPSNERAQFSIVVHNVRVTDCSPNSASSTVFDSMSDKSFFDLCVRTRGPLNADLIRVDLFDLNLAYGDGKAEKIVVNTGEDFVWRLLDIANRTMLATADLAGVDLDLKWDEKAGKFSVAVSDPILKEVDDLDLGTFDSISLRVYLHTYELLSNC